MQQQLSRVIGSAMLAALVLAGCSKPKTSESTQAQAAGTAITSEEEKRYALQQFAGGADQEMIRNYYDHIQEVAAKQFSVRWHPDVVPVSREEARRSLLEISPGGRDFTFSSTEPVIQKIEAGKIVWIWGMALARVSAVGHFMNTTILHTVPVSLNAAMIDADIEAEAPLDYSRAISVFRPPEPAKVARTGPVAGNPLLRNVLYDNPEPGAGSLPTAPDTSELELPSPTLKGEHGKVPGFEYSLIYDIENPQKLSFELEASAEEESNSDGVSNEMSRDQGREFDAAVAEWDEQKKQVNENIKQGEEIDAQLKEIRRIETQLRPTSPDATIPEASQQALAKLHLMRDSPMTYSLLKKLEVKRQAEYDQLVVDYNKAKTAENVAAKKARNIAWYKGKALWVFYVVKENVDVRFRTKVEMDRALLGTGIHISKGATTSGHIDFHNLKGIIDFEVVARLGRAGNKGISLPLAHVPVAVNIPFIVGGVPIVGQFAGDFLLKGFWAGKFASHHFAARYEFQGDVSMLVTDSKVDFNQSLSGTPVQLTEEPVAQSPGVSGLVLGVQTPRIGVGIGVPSINTMVYVDHVTVLTITNSASVATLNPPCQRLTLDRRAHLGWDINLWLLPVPVDMAKMEIWKNPKPWERVSPDIAMCRIGNT